MRLFTWLLIFILAALHTHAQEKMLLTFSSYSRKLCVTPQRSMVITTRSGDVAITDSLNGYWHKVSTERDASSGDRPWIEQGNFFNRDTGFVSGHIYSDKKTNDVIYHTQNGGKSWRAVTIGVDGWVDDACHLDNGEAWLSVGYKGITYTNDYGLSWKRLSNPNREQRFTSIYFNTKREGLAGSSKNMLAFTTDNCRHWKIIPTPLDQKKYNKTDLRGDPQINHTAIFKDYLLAKQEDLLFYTKRDAINWIPLPDYTDFFTDAANSALFFRLASGGFIRADNAMQPLSKADINPDCYDVTCKDGSLFVVTQDEVIQLLPDNTVRSSYIHTDRDADVEPERIGYALGAIGNNIFTQQEYNGPWDFVLTLPFKTDSGYLRALKDNRILYYKGRDSVYDYNIATNRVEKKDLRQLLSSFMEPGIKKIIYNESSNGCFYSYDNEAPYKKDNGNFKRLYKNTTLRTAIEKIDGAAVADFVRKLPGFYHIYPSIQDLGFTEEDYEQCKRDIIKFRNDIEKFRKNPGEGDFYLYENNIDFDRLLSTVDTIKQLNDTILHKLLIDLNNASSTTVNSVGLTIVNEVNSTMTILNRSSHANALYFPWQVSIDGISTVMYAMPITRFIRETCPSLLTETNRIKVLHTFVRKLYK